MLWIAGTEFRCGQIDSQKGSIRGNYFSVRFPRSQQVLKKESRICSRTERQEGRTHTLCSDLLMNGCDRMANPPV